MSNIKRRDFMALGIGLVTELATEKLSFAKSVPLADRNALDPNSYALKFKNGALSFNTRWCEIPSWKLTLEVNGNTLSSYDAKAEVLQMEPLHLALHFEKEQVVWTIRTENDPVHGRVFLSSSIHNGSKQPIQIGKAYLFHAEVVNGLLQPTDTVVYLPMSSSQGLNEVRPLEKTTQSDGIALQAFNQTQSKALQVGFVTFFRAKTQIQHLRTDGGANLRAWCEFDGWELEAGSNTPTETFTLAVGDNPRQQLEQWAEVVAQINPIPFKPDADIGNGWLGGAWVDTGSSELYQDVVLRNAKSLHTRLAGFGIEYIWMSIGNLKDGQPGDWLSWNERNFPRGHQYLNDELTKLDLKWGLWCAPFMLSSKLEDKVRNLSDALAHLADGKEPWVCSPAWGYGLDSPTEDYMKPVYALDPSHPKTIQFLTEVFQTYRKWGVRYYMIDFLFAGADTLNKTKELRAKHYDKKLVSGPEVFRRGLQTIRDAAGADTYLLAATGPTYETAGIFNAVRVGNDFGEGRSIATGFTTYPGTYSLKPATEWNGPVHALTNQAATYHTHRKFYINNSGNVLTIDSPLQLGQAQINATIHALSGGPSMLGDDITYINDERLSLIKKTLPRPLHVATPLDLFTRPKRGCPRVYHRRISNAHESYDVLAIYNLDANVTLTQEVDLRECGLETTQKYHAWEFWNNEYSGTVQGKLKVSVSPYSVKVYRLTLDAGNPVVIGTDMHILMGEVEIATSQWDSTKRTHTGRAARPVGETGSVFIYAPPKLGVVNPKGYFLGKDIVNNCLVIRCPLHFENGTAEWNLEFYELTATAPEKPPF